jgi:dihydrofolate reductase
MGRPKLSITMSLDGFVAGPDQTEENPLGIGGEQLHGWLLALEAFRETHGEEGGQVNASTPIAEGILANMGATIIGRNMFGGGPGPWGDDPWRGYWGDDPPYHHPVFVLTQHPRAAEEDRHDRDEDLVEQSGGGSRLFDNLGDPPPTLRQVQAIEAPGVTHIRYVLAGEDR